MQTGDDDWFDAMFEQHRGAVFSTALRLCGRWTDAEDLTAEAFLRAYRSAREYDSERWAGIEPRPWLITIVLNLWRNQQRASARRPRTEPIEHIDDPAQPGEGVEQRVVRHQSEDQLTALLAELPTQQRIAIVLRHVADFPISRIATELGVPEGTVKSHISRGLSRLRTHYSPLEEATT